VHAALNGPHPALKLIAFTTNPSELLLLLAQLCVGLLLCGERPSENRSGAEEKNGPPQICLR
jgi:hypothetical protein